MATERSERVACWWVNQGKTYEAERDGGYIWAPQHARNGATYGHHAAVKTVRPGDLIVHYARGAVQAIGRAATDGYAADRSTSRLNSARSTQQFERTLMAHSTPKAA